MATLKINLTNGQTMTIYSEDVSRIFDAGDYRQVWLGDGTTAGSGTRTFNCKNTLSSM